MGETDGGAYSIAAAYSAALETKLHMVMFEDEKLTPPPPAKKLVQRCREKHVFVQVYYVCGLPESYDTQVIDCEQCQKWFHFNCMKLVTEPDSWVCSQCV